MATRLSAQSVSELSNPFEGVSSADWLFNDKQLGLWQQQSQTVLDLLVDTVKKVEKPFSGILPEELAGQFRSVDLNHPLGDNDKALAELYNLYLRDAVWFHHPKYLAHLNCPVVLPSLAAEQILAAVNTSVDTWDQSAGGTLIEQKVIDWTLQRIGLPPRSDGIFTSGGTQSNLMAMLLARDCWCESHHPGHLVKYRGLPPDAGKWRIFASSLSHFSIQKSMAILGLGYDAVVAVDCDARYRMDVKALEREIQRSRDEGLIPIAVVATGGTTDFGSIDPLEEIADLCQRSGLWMHVDAAYGCGLLVSEQHRQRLCGIERADSVTVDYHKSFFQTVSCGAFFVRDKQNLKHVTHHADYLNPLSAQQEGTPNLVNKSIQTTRRFDALKMWLTLRIMGPVALGNAFDSVLHLAQIAHRLLSDHPEIEVLHAPELSTQVFRFRPDRMLSDTQIDEMNAAIRKAMFRSGRAIIAGTRVDGRQYLKFTLLNPTTTSADLDEVISLIAHYGREYLRPSSVTQ